MNQKGLSPIFLLISIALLISLLVGAYYLGSLKNNSESQIQDVVQQTVPSPTISTNMQEESSKSSELSFISKKCDFQIRYPKEWSVTEPTPNPNAINPDYGIFCAIFTSDPMQTDMGFSLWISRTKIGAKYKSETINSIEDLAKTYDYDLGPEDKTIGTLKGKYFEIYGQGVTSMTIIEQNNYLYEIRWSKSLEGAHSNKVEEILSSLQFNE